MKTKLPERHKNFAQYNYDYKLAQGLYVSIGLKLIKFNCKNYQINSTGEITISTTDEFSIVTIRASRKERTQYLITNELSKFQLDKIANRYLPDDFKEYILLGLESIHNFDEMSIGDFEIYLEATPFYRFDKTNL